MEHPLATTHTLRVRLSPLELTATAAYGLHWGSERMMLSVPHPTAAAVSCWSMSSRTMDSSLKQPQLAATRRSAHLDAARGDRHERTSTSVWHMHVRASGVAGDPWVSGLEGLVDHLHR